jgi:hypothetical protein
VSPILAVSILLLRLFAGRDAIEGADEIRLTVYRDPYVSSDQVTVCRVRADNLGGRRWAGRDLAFEVRVPGASPAVKARGRFGLTLEPYGSLETIVALPGRRDRFEVVRMPPRGGDRDSTIRRKGSRSKRRPSGASH